MVSYSGYNKRGWMRILEATIAVMIVTGVMIAVYSQQSSRVTTVGEYFEDIQDQILSDVTSRSDLRLNILNTVVDDVSDPNFLIINNFIGERVPESSGYFIRICDLGDEEDFCKMDTATYLATMDKDVFVEDAIISSDLGAGGGDVIYSPKKIRLFVWEGGYPEDFCVDECSPEGEIVDCSMDSLGIRTRMCMSDYDEDSCLEYDVLAESIVLCAGGEVCSAGSCVIGCSDECSTPGVEYDCSVDLTHVTSRTCGDSDVDTCLEWDGPFVPITPSCEDSGQMCSDGGCVAVYPVLIASYELGNQNEGMKPAACNAPYNVWYYYNMEIEETGEVLGATLGSRQRCYHSDQPNDDCDPLMTTMPDSFGGNVVPAGGSLTGTDMWFCLVSGYNYEVTDTFYSDIYGNDVFVSYTMSADANLPA